MSSGTIRDYKDLRAWQEAMVLCRLVYALVKGFPGPERFELGGQMCRAAISAPSNIAEGYGRGSRSDYARFVRVARGSANELQTQILIAEDAELGNAEVIAQAKDQAQLVLRLVQGLLRALEG